MLGRRDLGQRLRGRHVHDVERHVAGDLGEFDRPVRGLTLQLGGPGERVELRVGVAAGDRLGDEYVDGDAVLGVHHDHRPGLGGVLHRSQDLAVVGVEDARVGHEQLEARDALVVDEVGHRLERLLVDATDDLVERVVDRALTGGLVVPRTERILHAAARVLHGEVDDRRDAAPRRGAGAGLERVGRLGATERHLHVGVHVDAAGHDVLAGGVDRAIGHDAHRRRPGRGRGWRRSSRRRRAHRPRGARRPRRRCRPRSGWCSSAHPSTISP